MQKRGVLTGVETAAVLNDLMSHPNLKNARLHMVGHSFGALVVANAARALTRVHKRTMHNVCFIEGAFASGWFMIEKPIIDNITGRLASIFSVADSATGFYYPFANGGRLAMGSVGLCDIPHPAAWPAGDGLVPMAVTPCDPGCQIAHVHRAPSYAALSGPPPLPGNPGHPTVINLDGSKMIYEGEVASGGGHTDVYKDDVTYLLWAALHS
jgi:hypothetical protein